MKAAMHCHRLGRVALGVALMGLPHLAGGQPPETERSTLATGLVVESVRASIPPSVDAGDGIITVVRIDPARYRFRLLTAAEHGRSRTAPDWARDFELTGVINASMFQSGGRSTGLMADGKREGSEAV